MADLDLEEYDELEDDYWNLDENMGAPKMTDEAQYDDWNVGENTLAPTITDDDFFESGFSEKPAEMIPVADDFLSGWNNVNAYVGDPEAEPEQYVEDLHTDEFAEEFHSPADYCAEVVTIHTTMSGLPLKYFESIRIRHLLNCKGIPYTLINTNKEFSSAMNLMDLDLLEEWKAAALLSLDPVESNVVPQVLVDGVYLGGHRSLQDLEEDGDLDLICARILCPSCGTARDVDSLMCVVCQAEFKLLIPVEAFDSGGVLTIIGGNIVTEHAFDLGK